MSTLRARIAALLVVAIVAVVVLATLAAVFVLSGPRPEDTIEPVARMVQAIAANVEADGLAQAGSEFSVAKQPAAGRPDTIISGLLTEAFSRTGTKRDAVVAEIGDEQRLVASVALSNGEWLVFRMPRFKPPSGQWKIFAMWILLILAGSSLVAVYASSMITRPLRLVEKAANSIGSDALIVPIPETGPGEVRATAEALNRLSARLGKSIESRMRLVAAAGHDLRTPMTRMRLRAEFIADEEQREKWLADLAELDMIADSAITLVREEVGPSGVEIIRLDSLLAEISEEMGMLNLEAKIGEMGAVSVKAGPTALKRALRNLVVNAATHGGGAAIELSCRGDDAIVTITDEGPGIPDDQLDQVFEPFFRVDISRRKTVPGAGLGMAIAREIIQRYRGKVTVENRPGGGLLQQVVLPVRPTTVPVPTRAKETES